jgi:large subunit ribosomal protein L1
VKKAVEDAKGGAIEFRAEKAGVVQVGLGKASFDEKKLIENVKAFLSEIQRVRPSGAKGTYFKKATLSTTMGPGIKLDISNYTGVLPRAA